MIRTAFVALLAALGLGLACPAAAQERELDPSVILLLDTSGSMSGQGMATAQSALGSLIDYLQDDGTYSIGLAKGSATNVVVAPGSRDFGTVRSLIGFGNGDGNPIAQLDAFADRTLPAYGNKCHVVVLVTDGNDGINPIGAAQRIRARCSRLFVVGVNLDPVSVSTLTAIAQAGGGVFCNGQDPASVGRCLTSVFRPYEYREAANACADVNGVRGYNKLPTPTQVGRRLNAPKADFTCLDFRGVDLAAPQWAGVFWRQGADFSGSNFTGQNFPYAGLSGVRLNGAVFDNANLIGAKVSVEALGAWTSFRGAQLSGAAFKGAGGSCARRISFAGADLRSVSFTSAKFCNAVVPSRLIGPVITDSTFTDLSSDTGDLSFEGAAIDRTLFDGMTFNRLSFGPTTETTSVTRRTGMTLKRVRVQTLAMIDPDYSQAVNVEGLNASVSVELQGAMGRLAVSEVYTPRFLLAGSWQTLKLRSGQITDLAIAGSGDTAQFAGLTVQTGRFGVDNIWIAGKVGFTEKFACAACAIQQNSGTLTIDDARLPGLNLKGAMTLSVSDAGLPRMVFNGVTMSDTSSFEKVDLSGAQFIRSPLKAPLRETDLRSSRFDQDSPVRLVDGDEAVNFSDVEFGREVEIATAYLKNIRFVNARGRPIGTSPQAFELRQAVTGGEREVEIDGLDLSGARVALSQPGLSCNLCRFDKAEAELRIRDANFTAGSFAGTRLTLREADKAEFDKTSFQGTQFLSDITGVHVSRSDFSRAAILTIKDSQFDASNFTGAVFGAGSRHNIDGSEFTACVMADARFVEVWIKTTSFDGCSFDRVRYEGNGWQERVVYTRPRFTGADFGATQLHDVTFESGAFNGPSGPTKFTGYVPSTVRSKVVFNGGDLSGLNLERVNLVDSVFSGVDLRRANLQWIKLERVKIEASRFDGADLTNARFEGDISGSSFDGAKADGLWIDGSLIDSSFVGLQTNIGMGVAALPSRLESVDLSRSNLWNTLLVPIRPSPLHAEFKDVVLEGAVVACHWKSDIDASGPGAVSGRFTWHATAISNSVNQFCN